LIVPWACHVVREAVLAPYTVVKFTAGQNRVMTKRTFRADDGDDYEISPGALGDAGQGTV
jgi:hypothetical protein